jgi:hypothetical protein
MQDRRVWGGGSLKMLLTRVEHYNPMHWWTQGDWDTEE